MLNRNFVPNLPLQPSKARIMYTRKDGSIHAKRKYDVEIVNQGIMFSDSVLNYFKSVFDSGFDESGNPKSEFSFDKDIYLPFTNALDFQCQTALVPNTHPDFSSVSTRAYYDHLFSEWMKRVKHYGIRAISTYAVVDGGSGNHLGEFLVKVQKQFDDGFRYIIARLNVLDGRFCRKKTDGTLDISIFKSDADEILSLCEKDYSEDADYGHSDKVWDTTYGELAYSRSSTSSRISIFKQKIPDDHELRDVRNYIQFKKRLEGMEAYMKYLDLDIQSKETQTSECFADMTLAIWEMFKGIAAHRTVLEKVGELNGLLKDYDGFRTTWLTMKKMLSQKKELLDGLIDEYNSLKSVELEKKIDLGRKIETLKLEIDKGIKDRMKELERQISSLCEKMEKLKKEIREFHTGSDEVKIDDWASFYKKFKEGFDSRMKEASESGDIEWLRTSSEDESDEELERIIDTRLTRFDNRMCGGCSSDVLVDASKLEVLVKNTERLRDWMLATGYELSMLKKMRTEADDATIMVRRLVHNFKERIESAQKEFWTSDFKMKDDFSFNSISSASIRDVILLHDWYACNADGLNAEDLGMTESEFRNFRVCCNSFSLYVRRNQYAESIADRKMKISDLINSIYDRIGSVGRLKYKDEYGLDAKKADEKVWSVEDASKESVERISSIVKAYYDIKNAELDDAQYKKDAELMESRTIGYLKGIGLINDESELEGLALRNKTVHYDGDVNSELRKIELKKTALDEAKGKMERHRVNLQRIIDGIAEIEMKVLGLERENEEISSMLKKMSSSKSKKNAVERKSLFVKKIENDERISELNSTAGNARRNNLDDFSTLKFLRDKVDKAQAEYDEAVKKFKDEIGLDDDAIKELVTRIYNDNQAEILGNGGGK